MKFLQMTLLMMLVSFSTQLLAGDNHDDHNHHENNGASHIPKQHEAAEPGNGDVHDHHYEHDEHEDENGEHSHSDEAHEDEARIWTPNMLSRHQVGLATAKPASLQQTHRLYGNIMLSPQGVSHVRARYPGLIRSVHVNIGDTVKLGDKLATVESNDSLRTYTIKAALSGTVIERHANTGEATQNQVLFSIAELDSQWLELKVYPTQFGSIRAGQTARFSLNGQAFEAMISYLLPVVDQPYQLARAKLDAMQDSFVGSYIQADVETAAFRAEVAVAKNAIQSMDGQSGIFVAAFENDNQLRFEFRPLELGRRDSQWVEVLHGLSPGTQYVANNSYLIKADAEKAEAEHVH